jgi:hypothetical protein
MHCTHYTGALPDGRIFLLNNAVLDPKNKSEDSVVGVERVERVQGGQGVRRGGANLKQV